MDNNATDRAMEHNDDIEVRLWAYIDGISEEKTVIEELIAENAEWRDKYAELLDVHQLVQSTEIEEPSLRFTKNVMEEIARLQITPAAKQYINTKIIWAIVAFFFTIIVSFLVYGFLQVDWAAGSNTGDSVVDITNFDYSRMFSNSFVNLFMMANVVLGLLLLDRFLAAKRKKYMDENFQ